MTYASRQSPINLQREFELSQSNMDHCFERRIQNELGVGSDAQKRLMIGKMRICYDRNTWWPAKRNELAAPTVVIMPTSFSNGWMVNDLMATDGQRCWFSLGLDDWLGDPNEMPIHTSIGGYLKSGGKGCVHLNIFRKAA
jgi:hypothetical protein